MEIKTIHYKRVKNIGNYENETLEAFADITEGENVSQAIAELKHTVLAGLDLLPPEETSFFGVPESSHLNGIVKDPDIAF